MGRSTQGEAATISSERAFALVCTGALQQANGDRRVSTQSGRSAAARIEAVHAFGLGVVAIWIVFGEILA
jgi:hypothetical protein